MFRWQTDHWIMQICQIETKFKLNYHFTTNQWLLLYYCATFLHQILKFCQENAQWKNASICRDISLRLIFTENIDREMFFYTIYQQDQKRHTEIIRLITDTWWLMSMNFLFTWRLDKCQAIETLNYCLSMIKILWSYKVPYFSILDFSTIYVT